MKKKKERKKCGQILFLRKFKRENERRGWRLGFVKKKLKFVKE